MTVRIVVKVTVIVIKSPFKVQAKLCKMLLALRDGGTSG